MILEYSRVSRLSPRTLVIGNGAEVVVYRSHYNSNSGKWGKVNLNDPIKVGDVIKYQKSKANVAKLNAVLRPITAKPKKK